MGDGCDDFWSVVDGGDPMAPDDTRGEPCDVCGVWPCQHTDPETWSWGDDGQPVEINTQEPKDV